ncbi:hypothetical protein VB636_00680, partial [Paracoccus sp. APAP_BH8]|uniref:hypothetical protein n=1 Tax=Paracoccus sp. APAP_BH8 TaxID=3110237 RepID=UPI002FD81BBE
MGLPVTLVALLISVEPLIDMGCSCARTSFTRSRRGSCDDPALQVLFVAILFGIGLILIGDKG